MKLTKEIFDELISALTRQENDYVCMEDETTKKMFNRNKKATSWVLEKAKKDKVHRS